MKKFFSIISLSLLVSGCSAWDKGGAKTFEQKRDYLLKYGPQYVPNYLQPQTLIPQPPITVNELRNKLIANGGETNEFIKEVVSKCFASSFYDKDCTIAEYYRENERIEEKRKKAEEKSKQTPVKKGDLFYCRMTIHQAGGPINTSNARVRVKDNVDSVGFLFPNDHLIISPILRVEDPDSGMRRGNNDDFSLVVTASYDGSSYSIRLSNVVIDTYRLGLSDEVIDVWGCEKVK